MTDRQIGKLRSPKLDRQAMSSEPAEFKALMVLMREYRAEMEVEINAMQTELNGVMNLLHIAQGGGKGLKNVPAVETPTSATEWLEAKLAKAGLVECKALLSSAATGERLGNQAELKHQVDCRSLA